MGNTSYNGNRGQARQTAETIQYKTFNLSEEYNRRRQDRLNYEAMKFNKNLDYRFVK